MSLLIRINRLILGAVLFLAACLKIYGLNVSAVPQIGWLSRPLLQIAVAEWEIVLGLWLISGSSTLRSWLIATITFVIFAIISGYYGWIGVASCGCFGAIRASPWYAFAIDIFALFLLAINRPRTLDSMRQEWRGSVGAGLKWVAGVIVILAGMTLGAVWYAGSVEATLAHFRGESLSVNHPYIDFGAGQPGQYLEENVIIHNWTDQSVRLIGGTSDCSCTSLIDLPITVKPLETEAVRVRLRVPMSSSGRLTRTAFVLTDCVKQPKVEFRVGCLVE